MRFGAMGLAAFGGGASGVEVAQRGVVQSGVAAIIGEDLFEKQLALAIGIDGSFVMVLGNRNRFGFAVGGGGGRKNEFFHAVASDRIQQIDAARNVSSVKRAGLAHGFGNQGFGGEMHYGVDFILIENFLNMRAHGQVDVAKDRAGRHGFAVAFD